MNKVNKLKYQYSSRHQRATQKIWNTKNGAVACSPNNSENEGIGILNSFKPYSDVSSGIAADLSGVGVRKVRKGGRADEG